MANGRDPTPTPVNAVDVSDLVQIILIKLAIIFLLLGVIGGQPLAGVIVAVIVLVIVLLFSDAFAQMIFGTFEWPKLF